MKPRRLLFRAADLALSARTAHAGRIAFSFC